MVDESEDGGATPGPQGGEQLSEEGQRIVGNIKKFLGASRAIAYAVTAILVALKLTGRIDSGWLVVLSPLLLQILASAAVTAWFGFVVAPREIEKMERRGPPDHSG